MTTSFSRLAGAALAVFLAGAAPLHAADWRVDPAKSTLGFTGSQSGQSFDGRFSRWDATISFDPAHPESGHARVVIDMASAATGDRQRDAALPESDWFDIKAFPQAVFEATSFRPRGGNAYDAVGSLTIRGIRKDVVLPFTLDIAGDAAHAQGRLPLLRTDYGVGQGDWSNGQWVGLDVAVTVDLTAVRQP